MKIKTIALLALLPGLAILSQSCKKDNARYWVSWGEGNISYNSTRNDTSLRIVFDVVSWNAIDAQITGWRIVFKAGKARLLEVNAGNYLDYVPFVVFTPVRHNDTASFLMQSANPDNLADRRPYPGQLFPGDAPTNIDVFVTISDQNGKTETIEQNLLVSYSTTQ